MRSSKPFRRGAVPVVCALGLALAGCGSSSQATAQPSSTTTTTKPQTLSQRYTTVVSNGDKELQHLSTQLNGANGNVVEIQAGFRAVSAAYQSVAREVQGLPFPASMHNDVTAMVTALNKLTADTSLGAQSVTTTQFDSVFSQLATDQKAEVAANNKVNHDLGISSIN